MDDKVHPTSDNSRVAGGEQSQSHDEKCERDLHQNGMNEKTNNRKKILSSVVGEEEQEMMSLPANVPSLHYRDEEASLPSPMWLPLSTAAPRPQPASPLPPPLTPPTSTTVPTSTVTHPPGNHHHHHHLRSPPHPPNQDDGQKHSSPWPRSSTSIPTRDASGASSVLAVPFLSEYDKKYDDQMKNKNKMQAYYEVERLMERDILLV